MEIVGAVVVGMGSLITLGLVFLVVGDIWAKRAPTGEGDLFPTLHLVALVAAIVGVAVAGMAWASDHPTKWGQLSCPLIFVAIVYGYALGFSLTNWKHLIRDIWIRVNRRNAG